MKILGEGPEPDNLKILGPIFIPALLPSWYRLGPLVTKGQNK